ncbi:MAG: anti-phage protein KwaB [Pseudobdellovibrionaceae bacterium]
MTAEELKAELQAFYNKYDQINVSVYAILKDQNDMGPKKVDISADALAGIKGLFIDSLRKQISEKDNLSVLNLSTSDERLDAIYLYDIDLPEELLAIEGVTRNDGVALLDLESHDLSDIKALLIEIGDNERQIVLYKTIAPINIFGRASFFLKKDRTRMEKIDDEFLRVSAGFQLARIAGNLFVFELEAIEKSFGFHEIIVREAALGISAIERMELVENPDVLHELLAEVKYARRFTKVAKASPVMRAGVSNENIISFCKNFPRLAGKIRFNPAGDKILLDTKVSKDLFIKLLMDDFLTSELTKYHYDSVAKDLAEPEEGEALAA